MAPPRSLPRVLTTTSAAATNDSKAAGRSPSSTSRACAKLPLAPGRPEKQQETHVTSAVAVPLSFAGKLLKPSKDKEKSRRKWARPHAASTLEPGSRKEPAFTPKPTRSVGISRVSRSRCAARPSPGLSASVRRRKDPAPKQSACLSDSPKAVDNICRCSLEDSGLA
mmetsp:Transcript_8488/g.24262  ORF Transcript_8488/g.24262 Transcript_8488/m.24262 type:complete len:167 (-) Transcript_8488:20-520(-)